MGTTVNVSRLDLDTAIDHLTAMRDAMLGESGPVEIPTGECPAAPAIREAVGGLFSRMGRFLTSNARK